MVTSKILSESGSRVQIRTIFNSADSIKSYHFGAFYCCIDRHDEEIRVCGKRACSLERDGVFIDQNSRVTRFHGLLAVLQDQSASIVVPVMEHTPEVIGSGSCKIKLLMSNYPSWLILVIVTAELILTYEAESPYLVVYNLGPYGATQWTNSYPRVIP